MDHSVEGGGRGGLIGSREQAKTPSLSTDTLATSYYMLKRGLKPLATTIQYLWNRGTLVNASNYSSYQASLLKNNFGMKTNTLCVVLT